MDDLRTVPVYLVDDDASVRSALRYVLEGYDFQIQDFESGDLFLNQAPLDRPGCLILDHRMPGGSVAGKKRPYRDGQQIGGAQQ